MAEPFAYDTVAYRTHAMPQAHPDRLFVVGSLFGLSPKPAEACRYLEVGCGTGTHLIAAALTLPNARFVGIDLSEVAIGYGKKLVADLGLTNVELAHADLMTWNPGPEPFDYLAAHGLYSWVPAAVRDRLLAVANQALAPDGLAYVSYNALPGGHLRRVLWDMLRFHTWEATGPAEQIAEAHGFLRFLQEGLAKTDNLFGAAVRFEAEKASSPEDAYLLFHDDLSPTNEPVYVTDFVTHAGRHGLGFVSEAVLSTQSAAAFPPEIGKALTGLRKQNPILREQYLDFLKLRRFRQTVLCRADRTPLAEPSAEAVLELSVSTLSSRATETVDLSPGVPMAFGTPDGTKVTVDRPLPKAALTVLCERSPERVPLYDLVDAIAARLGDPDAARPWEVANLILDAHANGFVDLHAHRPAVALTPGERPTASPLARREAATGNTVTTLFHSTLRLEDEPSRKLVQLMDGSRDRAALAAGLHGLVPADQLEVGLTNSLAFLAKAGLLVG